jgi:RNA polymerase sigma-70 factor (ECF subfamily)
MDRQHQAPGPVQGSQRLSSDRAPAGEAWEDLLVRVAARDERAFECLYDQSNALLFGLVLRIVGQRADAEEVTFDIYQQIWAQAARFDRQRSSAAGWMVMIARSRSLDFLRSSTFQHARRTTAAEDAPPLQSAAPPPDEVEFCRQRRAAIKNALEELPEDQRTLVELAFFEGMSHSELAARVSIPLGTVKTRIRSALGKLRGSLARIRGDG